MKRMLKIGLYIISIILLSLSAAADSGYAKGKLACSEIGANCANLSINNWCDEYGTSQGAWTRSGNYVYLTNAADHVGLGTNSLPQQLTLTKCLRFDYAGTSNVDVDMCNDDASYNDDGVTMRILSNPANGEPIFRVLSSGGSERLRVEQGGTTKTSNNLEVAGTGNSFIGSELGIGTTSTDADLTIYKSGGGAADMIHMGDTVDGKNLVMYYDGLDYELRSATGGGGNMLVSFDDTTGNVGMATESAPASRLSVGGAGSSSYGIYGESTTYGIYADGTNYGLYGIGDSNTNSNVYDFGLYGYVQDSSGTNFGGYVEAGTTDANYAYATYAYAYRGGTGTHRSGHFYDQGTGGTYNGLYADLRSGDSIDIAEYIYDTHNDTEAADVVVADPDNDESVVLSNKPFDDSVVGVITTAPHMVMGIDIVLNETTDEFYNMNITKLTLDGRVPIKVIDENGPIRRGDLLTTSSTPGYAMRWSLLDIEKANDFEEMKSMIAENERRKNSIIGKAASELEEDEGKIVALINLQ